MYYSFLRFNDVIKLLEKGKGSLNCRLNIEHNCILREREPLPVPHLLPSLSCRLEKAPESVSSMNFSLLSGAEENLLVEPQNWCN